MLCISWRADMENLSNNQELKSRDLNVWFGGKYCKEKLYCSLTWDENVKWSSKKGHKTSSLIANLTYLFWSTAVFLTDKLCILLKIYKVQVGWQLFFLFDKKQVLESYTTSYKLTASLKTALKTTSISQN